MKLDFASIKKYLSLFTLLFAVVLIGAADKGLEDIINPFNLQDERRFDQSVPLDRFSKPQCGDGAVQKGEVCDPLGSTKRENCKIGGNKSGIRIKTCSNDCSKWNKGQCKPKVICGNGIIEGNENCDDGNLNGQYGQCAGSKSSKKLKIGKPQGNVPPVDSTGTVKLNITSIKDTQVKKCSAPHPAYCGNGRLDYNKKGRPLEACDTVKVKDEDRCLFADGKIGSKPCSSYATSTYNSCASDCQSGGGFCGDGEVQSPEECDDGNNSNEDSCSNQCKKIEPPEPKKGPKKCGNGKVEQGEKCDQGKQKGKQNGIKCTPKYGKSCTYCSADCQNILTVDPKRFCGNAEIDKRGTDEKGNTLYEACELRDGKVISSTSKNLQVGEKYCWNFAAGYGKTCSSESDCSKTKIKNTKTETIKWEKRSKKTEAITFGRNNLETFKAKEKDAEKVIDLTQEITASVIKVSVSPQQVLITFNHQNKNKKITPSSVTLDPGETKNIKIQTMQVIDIGSCKKYTPFVSCLDKGEYQCTNQCNTLKDTCTECVKYKGNNSVPKLSVLNPLIAGNENKNIQWGMKSKNIKPQASFKWVLKKNRKVSFTDLSTDPDGNIKKIEWDFDNKKNKGNDATGKKVSHTYSSDGSYTVKLTVTDNQGNSNSISKSLKVKSGKQRRGKKTQKGLVIKATEGNKEIKASVPSAVKAIGIANSSTKASVYLGMKNKKLAKRDSGLSSGSITKLSGTPVEIAVAGKDKNVDIYVALKDKNKIIRMDKNLKTLKSKDLSAPPTSLAVATGRNNKKRRVFVGLKNKKIKKFDENFGEVGTNNEITLSNTPTTLAIGEKGVKQQQFPINYSKIYVGARGGKLYKIPGLDFKDNPSEYEDMSLSATPETIGAIGEYANHFVYVGLENKKIVRINNGKFKKTATNKLSANPINLGVAGTKKNPDIYAALSNKDIIKLGKNKLNRKKLLTSTSYVAETMDVVGGKNNSDAEVFAGMGKKRASPKGGGGAGGGG
ncbi:MAG: PKD domain-containing protein, partial [Candidatus Magasanikbacteria bacterium]